MIHHYINIYNSSLLLLVVVLLFVALNDVRQILSIQLPNKLSQQLLLLLAVEDQAEFIALE